MPHRPTVFISSVSKELRGARQLVANTLTFLGYEPMWQDVFGMESGDLRQMLRQKVDQAQGVVQLVGQCYGEEPPTTDPEFGRVSFTQYEALYGRKAGKKVWYLFIDESFPVEPHEPEPEDQRRLQAIYRNHLRSDTHLFHPLGTLEALESGVLKLRDDLTVLRRSARRWAWGVAAGILFIAVAVSLLLRGQGKTQGSLDQIAQRFESLSGNGGLIANAKTPEEHYHNARVHELGGNFTSARREYADYLASNLEVLDPWLSYSAMLKSTEGKAGAVEAMRAFGGKLTPQTVSYQTALALLADGEARLTQLQALAGSHPEYGPLDWLISQEYSEARRGDQSLADQRSEKDWLEKFRTANAGGRFEKYFLDRKEAQRWTEVAAARWVKVNGIPETVLENPVTLIALSSGDDFNLDFTLTDDHVKTIFFRLDGEGDFQSTGTRPFADSKTGLRDAATDAVLPNLSPGNHTVEVKYVDKNDKTNGPYTLRFSTADAMLAQGKSYVDSSRRTWVVLEKDRDDGRVMLMFSGLLGWRAVLKEIRYSLNDETLDKTFPFTPSDRLFASMRDVDYYRVVPPDTRFACVQVTFTDGTKSEVEKFVRAK